MNYQSPTNPAYPSTPAFPANTASPGTRFPNVSLAQARVEPGVTTEWRVLSVDEIYYVLEGSGAPQTWCIVHLRAAICAGGV